MIDFYIDQEKISNYKRILREKNHKKVHRTLHGLPYKATNNCQDGLISQLLNVLRANYDCYMRLI